MVGLKRAGEDPFITRPEFVYVTFVRTSPDRLWSALTGQAFTARYCGRTYDPEWTKGSRYRVTQSGVRVDDPEQIILEADPPHRLSYRWNTFNAELSGALGWSEEFRARIAAEARSRVTFEIEPEGDETVRLTVMHDGFEEGSALLESIGDSWPRVLANLKTLLETGG